ncbi:MAG: T9SS type B sorting domain-containing protein, partial [Chitinophagaceae bacterium]
YAVGPIGHIADMDPGPGVHTITTVHEYGASVLTKLNSNGALIYAASFESNGIDYGSSLTRRMVVDNSQNIYITGYLAGIIDFDPGPGVYELNSGSHQAPIVLKFSKCKNPTTSTLNINTCSSYTLDNEIFDSTGTYIRTMINSKGCDSVITLHLTVNKKYTEQTITICEGESFFAGGASQTGSGIYMDTLPTSLNCDSIVTTHLTVNPRPFPNFGTDRDLCAGTQSVISPGSFTKYLWQDMTTSNNFTVNAPGLYWVRVTNGFNCSAADSFIVRAMLPSPANFLRETDSICNYGGYELSPAGTYNQYLWSTGSVNNRIVIDQPGEYKLQVTDANGCVGTDSITLFKKECMNGIYIPTAFTPGNDGKNDLFKALVFGKVISFKLQVFDRAGQLIFQTTDPRKGWDGSNSGISYSTSVFVWQCFYQLDQQQPAYQKGTVTIVR